MEIDIGSIFKCTNRRKFRRTSLRTTNPETSTSCFDGAESCDGQNVSSHQFFNDPMGYQALFFNIPTVTGDIAMLLLIIIVLTGAVGILLWCSQHYVLDPRTTNYDGRAQS